MAVDPVVKPVAALAALVETQAQPAQTCVAARNALHSPKHFLGDSARPVRPYIRNSRKLRGRAMLAEAAGKRGCR